MINAMGQDRPLKPMALTYSFNYVRDRRSEDRRATQKPAPVRMTTPTGRPPMPHGKCRVLLALDGRQLTQDTLTTALMRCVELTDRLDILLVNSPKAPTSLLRSLLLRLEHSGIDYRLASTEGDLGEQVLHYVQRFLGITYVIVDHMTSLQQSMGEQIAQLSEKGYRFVEISPGVSPALPGAAAG